MKDEYELEPTNSKTLGIVRQHSLEELKISMDKSVSFDEWAFQDLVDVQQYLDGEVIKRKADIMLT